MVTEQIITKSDQKQTYVERIPKDWKIVQVGDHFNFKNGLNKAKKFFGQGTPIINYMNVYPYPEIYEKYIQGKVTLTNGELRTFDIRKGDVLFTRTSETLNEIGLSSVVLDDVKKTVFSGFLLRARPTTDLFGLEFKKYCFRSKNVRRQIISTSSKTTRALTNGKLLSKVSVLIPINQYEQLAISESISDIEKCIKQLDYLIEKKKNIKQGAIQEFLTGTKRLDGFNEKWIFTKLDEVAEMFSGGTPLTSNRSYYDGNIPWVIITDITKAKKYLYSTEKNITQQGLESCSAKIFQKGVLLFAMYASIGKCCIAKIDVTCNQAILGIVTKKIDTEFLYQHMVFSEKRFSQMGQTGTQNNLNKEMVQNLDIPYPHIDEQIAIGKILSDMDVEINELEKNRDKYVMIKNGMMQKLLTGEIRLK